MEGFVKTAWERLTEIKLKLEHGYYGESDDMDVQALEDDLDEVTDDLE